MKKTHRQEQGVALVVTVIVVAMLAVVGVALMQSTTADRASSRSVANYTRAKLAAEAGLAFVSASLSRNMTNDTFIVVANANRQLFVGNGSNQPAGSFAYTPAFSTVNSVTSAVTPIVSASVPATNPPAGPNTTNFTFTNQPGGLSVTSPPAISWVYLTNDTGQTNARFAFWVEDLAGKLDLSVVGTNTALPVARRPSGTNPAEIALWSVLNSNAISASASSGAGNSLVSARSNILTAATARLIDSAVTTSMLADFAANLRHDTNEPDLVPFGFGYADQGQPKCNLNTNINIGGVTAIVSAIDRNLPQFAERAGGYTNVGGGATNANAFTPLSYLQTLAANIIDYADTDSVPTTDGRALGTSRNRPDYRGVDSYPFVNEIAKRYRLLSNSIATNNGTVGRALLIETTDFFELWNPSSQVASGQFTFLVVHGQQISIGFLPTSFSTPTWASNSVGAVQGGITTNQFPGVSIPPNGFAVFDCPTVTNFFFVPSTNQIATVPVQTELTNSFYFSAWNGVYCDGALGGILRLQIGNLTSSPTNRANLPSFIYRATANAFTNPSVGDPRATIYLSLPVDAAAYDNNSSFGGRNVRSGIATNNSYAQVSPKSWPDNGHDSAAGQSAGSHGTLPTSVSLAPYTNAPPNRIQNSGSYSNIVELGAIFDPIQWAMPSLAAWEGKWTNLAAGGSAVPRNAFGGGTSLRVGRAEHPRFTNDGSRAAQLLDLFAVGETNSSGAVVRRMPGRINLNTASTNTLRALAAGVAHASDPALQPGTTNFFPPANVLAAFVHGVTNFRSVRPFFSAAQLPLISTDGQAFSWPTNSVFGNATLASVTEWNDVAAEEWFAKIYAVATVRSRNFIVYAVGQALQPNDPAKVLSTYRSGTQVYVSPEPRGADGLTTNCQIEAVTRWSY